MGAPLRLVMRLELEKQDGDEEEPEVIPLSVSRMDVAEPVRSEQGAGQALFLILQQVMMDLVAELRVDPKATPQVQYKQRKLADRVIPVRAKVYAKMIRASRDCFPIAFPGDGN